MYVRGPGAVDLQRNNRSGSCVYGRPPAIPRSTCPGLRFNQPRKNQAPGLMMMRAAKCGADMGVSGPRESTHPDGGRILQPGDTAPGDARPLPKLKSGAGSSFPASRPGEGWGRTGIRNPSPNPSPQPPTPTPNPNPQPPTPNPQPPTQSLPKCMISPTGIPLNLAGAPASQNFLLIHAASMPRPAAKPAIFASTSVQLPARSQSLELEAKRRPLNFPESSATSFLFNALRPSNAPICR
jgi:hypothetical protein